MRDEALVPAIWPLEVANVLLVGERKGRITPAGSKAFLASLAALPIVVDPIDSTRAFDAIVALGRRYKLSSYDASYLELALRHDLPLVTLDDGLRRAARAADIALP